MSKSQSFVDSFAALKYICYPVLAFLLTEMTDFPTLSYTSTNEIPTLLYT